MPILQDKFKASVCTNLGIRKMLLVELKLLSVVCAQLERVHGTPSTIPMLLDITSTSPDLGWSWVELSTMEREHKYRAHIPHI
jgi:hypothetical protein